MALHSPATFADMATLSSFTDPNRYSKGSELDSLGDYIGIDDLLDFSNEEIGGPIGDGSAEINVASSFKTFHTPTVLGPAELCVPCDDLAELEWLSNFVEESFSSENAFMINAVSSNLKEANGKESNVQVKKNEFQGASPVSVLQSSAKQACFSPEMAIPGRARSKRSRTGHTMWGTLILAAADTSANMVESSSTSTITVTAPNSPDMDVLKFEQQGATSLLCKKMKSSQNKVKKLFEAVQTRRCLHCGSQKTPQWRTGPMGPKTLCNACGVRYKSGRLLPEYRPAASPTFVESIHSNSHRKVLEMRKHKQESAQGEEPLLWQHQQQQIAGYESETCLVNTRLEEALLQDWQ